MDRVRLRMRKPARAALLTSGHQTAERYTRRRLAANRPDPAIDTEPDNLICASSLMAAKPSKLGRLTGAADR
jgi:hypothetical protein